MKASVIAAHARFPVYHRALMAQRVDVAVDGAQADAEAGSERGRADGTAAVAQVLQQGEQALATGHEGQVLYMQVSGKGVCKRIFGLLNGLHGSLVNATHRIYAISACNASSSALVRA